MTKEHIAEVLTKIADYAEEGDNEAAHALEDVMHSKFINLVANRDDELGALAKLIVSAEEIKFHRWCE